jgi:aerobic C4-dicarboxylate transport protein
MGEAMAVTNLIGNGVATIVVGKWCGQVNEAQLAEQLAGGRPAAVPDAAPVARAL